MIDQEWFGMNGAHHRGHRVTQSKLQIMDDQHERSVLLSALCGKKGF